MNDINIKSENQKGGITAQNVNTANNSSFQINSSNKKGASKEGKLKSIFWWIFGLIGMIAALVAIYKYIKQ